ncbi:MAG: glycerol kinase GlpK [Prolixibacteraceae bacterium]|nr:glycerol kinase GlpK [Prolixibacteraceae bacterium]
MGAKKDKKYILSIDQSTSATKALLFNHNGNLIDRATIAHQQFYPFPGFVEHDPVEIFSNALEGIKQVVGKNRIAPNELASIAITNQRETAMIWDKTTGKPVAKAAVWQCQRGADYCNTLKAEGHSETIAQKTGLIIDPYFSASKLHWIMNNLPGLKERALKGDLLLGTMDTWLLWKFTGGKVHATDYSNACRTMLFNINTLQWDEELINIFSLEKSMFPEVKFSDEIFGYTEPEFFAGVQVPVSGLLGDSHAALFGQNCFEQGMGKATYGTGSSIMLNIGENLLCSPEGLVTSIGYGLNKKVFYVFEGNIHCTGDTINWLKNDLQLINDFSEVEELIKTVDNSNGVYFVPAFVGLGAPYWDNNARACISGMPRNTTKAHVVRAALESIAYQIKDLIILMEGEIKLQELRVDGGPTKNNFLMQFQADILGRKVNRSEIEEVSAIGSAYMAGLATGFWKDTDEIKSLRNKGSIFEPEMDILTAAELYKGWDKAVKRTRL